VGWGTEPGLRWHRRKLKRTHGRGAHETLVAEAGAETGMARGAAAALAARGLSAERMMFMAGSASDVPGAAVTCHYRAKPAPLPAGLA